MVLLRGFSLQETAPVTAKPPASTSPVAPPGQGYSFQGGLNQGGLINQGQFINQQQVRTEGVKKSTFVEKR